MRVGVVDIGTNSTRLLVTGDGEAEVRRSVVTGLGRGLATTGVIGSVGREATLATLGDYRELLSGSAASKAVMTASGRDAADAASFIEEGSAVLGVELEVVSGADEARWSYRGAVSGLGPGEWTVVDIGGGSTEIVTSSWSASFDVGSVKVTDLHLDRGADVVTAYGWVLQTLTAPVGAAGTPVGVAGTWTSLAAMEGARPVHHSRLAGSAVTGWVDRLAPMTDDEKRRIPGLDPARAPVILGGAIVAQAVMTLLEATEIVISEHDLLDGLAAELASAPS